MLIRNLISMTIFPQSYPQELFYISKSGAHLQFGPFILTMTHVA